MRQYLEGEDESRSEEGRGPSEEQRFPGGLVAGAPTLSGTAVAGWKEKRHLIGSGKWTGLVDN